MALANQESQNLQHERLEPAHILYGLVAEGSGVGCAVLKNLGVSVQSLRKEVQKVLPPGEATPMGKIPHSDDAKRAIENAVLESHELNNNFVGTEHILLGLLRLEDPTTAAIFTAFGITSKEVRDGVFNLLGAATTEEAKVELTLQITAQQARQLIAQMSEQLSIKEA
jgi:ATP-dependent Clp protease ATP-binding subunit ClpC